MTSTWHTRNSFIQLHKVEVNKDTMSAISPEQTKLLNESGEDLLVAELRQQIAVYHDWVATVEQVCEAAAQGNLELRVLNKSKYPGCERASCLLNEVLDRGDAFVREAGAALDFASQGKFFRLVLLKGMLGSYKRASGVINSAMDDMKKQSGAIKDAEIKKLALADTFEEAVSGVVSVVASSATEMQATASALSKNADGTTERSTTVAAASEQASANVQSVSSAAEELAKSVTEISAQVNESSRMAGNARSEALQAGEAVKTLAQASERIGRVVGLISRIASQTNFLALNATIEAARAGEAGRGFKVVASEVKELSQQTASATEDIGKEVADIQSTTAKVVQVIQDISSTIEQLSETSESVARSVAEQKHATDDISRNVHELTIGVRDVSKNISEVTVAAHDTSTGASQMLSASGELAKQAEKLTKEVSTFLQTVRMR